MKVSASKTMKVSASKVTAAVNRFGLGAKPGDFKSARDPQAWLQRQVARDPDRGELFAGLPSSLDYERYAAQQHVLVRAQAEDLRGHYDFAFAGVPHKLAARISAGKDAIPELVALHQQMRNRRARRMLAEVAARYRVATLTDTPFLERLIHFWSNHFAVSVEKSKFLVQPFAAAFEREAIRPHVTGRFIDLLLSVQKHPAMLIYLDTFRSIGPGSTVGQKLAAGTATKCEIDGGRATGMNENLGREAMELHTVGVHAGYTQADVTEFSRALTGWSIPYFCQFMNGRQPKVAFEFHADAHEPGPRQVMGKTFAAGGIEQATAIFEFLARQPATAHHISLKLARHFVSDNPPPALVERMAKSYLEHDTDLAATYRTLIESDEAWDERARKFKTPQDFMISAMRAGQINLGTTPQPALILVGQLGEPLFEPRAPVGFSDDADSWIGANAIWKRLQTAEALAAYIPHTATSPLECARQTLGPALNKDTAHAIGQAGSVHEGYSTLFACPNFQWRV